MAELLNSILVAKDRVIMLLILSLAVMLVTYVIYVISGKSSFLKYLPGLLLTGAGIYYLYQGFQNITTRTGLNEFMSATIFGIIGLVGLAYALILGVYHQGEGQKTKRRTQALDYLQDAHRGEAVVYPKKKEEDYRENKEPLEEVPYTESVDAHDPLIPQPETKAHAQQATDALIIHEKQRQWEATKNTPVAVESDYEKQAARIDYAMDQKREKLHLEFLEKQLQLKYKHRDAIRAYNDRATEVNEKEDSSWSEIISLTATRIGLQWSRLLSKIRRFFGTKRIDTSIFFQRNVEKADARIRDLFSKNDEASQK